MALGIEVKIGLGIVLLSSVGFLVLSDISGSEESILEYVYVDQVMAEPDRFKDREFQVHGIVVVGSVKQKKDTPGDYLFVIERNGERVQVHYADVVPDTFAEGGEVVLTGRLDASGKRFEATEMTAKCPSKYEEDEMAGGRKQGAASDA
jgi:cytochrome c-type biogenesis protein CcmE